MHLLHGMKKNNASINKQRLLHREYIDVSYADYAICYKNIF